MVHAGEHLARGEVYMHNFDFEFAVHEFSQAIAKDEHCVRAYLCRALANEEWGGPSVTIPDYEAIIRLAPESADAAFARAKLLLKTDSQRPQSERPALYQQVIDLYTRAIELDSGLVYAYSERAGWYRTIGDLRQAALDYTRALELDPLYARAYLQRAEIYGRLGLFRAAIQDLETYLRLPAGASRNASQMRAIANYWWQLAERA